MSDNQEKFTNDVNTADASKPEQAANQPTAYGTAYNAKPAAQAYTWNNNTAAAPATYNAYAQPAPYHATQPAGEPKKRKGMPLAVKIIAAVLCCALVSGATLASFIGLVNGGYVNMPNGGSNAAFTISRVVNDDTATSDTVSQMSDQDIAEKLIPSVVCIQNYQVTEQYGFMYANAEDSSNVTPAGEGSGIVYSADGYILTNAHVIADATSLKVILSDGTTYEATVVGSDTLTDLAVIKIDATGLTAATFGSSEDLRVADKVIAIGNPGGYEFNSSVTIGYVSALNRAIVNTSTGYTMEFIQTDAAINPGNSGGALVNQYGQVVGINSAKISATGYEGLGFAIPSDFAQSVISDLMQYGYVKDRAMLGISGQFIDSMTGRFYGLPQGEYIGTLNTDQAKASGLAVGDVITAIDGTELTSEAVLKTALTEKKPNETVSLTVYRPSSKETLTIELKLSEYAGE